MVTCNSFQSLIVDGKKDFLENSLLRFIILAALEGFNTSQNPTN